MARTRQFGRRWLALFGLFCLGLILLFNALNIRHGISLFVLLGCIAGLALMNHGLLPLIDFIQKRERHAVQGAQAEEQVGAFLDRLPKEKFTVQHDVPAQYGNIDHVVVRSDGAVFAIETKSQRGTITERNGQLLVNGRAPQKDFLRQASRNAVWLSKDLQRSSGVRQWVTAAIVFPNANVQVRRKLGQVEVVGLHYLERWLTRGGDVERL